jgi:F420-non-reducing hydrogenase small subunit
MALKFAYLLVGGCGGCDMAIVDLSERLVDALGHLEVVFWAPTVADVKYKDLEAMPDQSIDLAFVSGMVRNKENEHLVKVLRQKAKILVAFGICAALGGIPGMANLHKKEELFENAYIKSPSTDNPDGIIPQPVSKEGEFELTLPEFLDEVKPVSAIVDVDYFVGGCPPHHEHVAKIVEAVVSGNLPPKGSWITNGKSVCDVCPRNPANKGETREFIGEVKRMHEGKVDEEKCLLQQGYLCLGPITQGDCGALCPKVGIRCAGCGGPIPPTKDFGLRAISAIGSILKDEKVVEQVFEKYPVLAKLVYRYALPGAMISKKIKFD